MVRVLGKSSIKRCLEGADSVDAGWLEAQAAQQTICRPVMSGSSEVIVYFCRDTHVSAKIAQNHGRRTYEWSCR